MKCSKLMLDKLSFTLPVKSRKKREAIHHGLQGYSHKGVETRYVRGFIPDYHDTMKFTVRYHGKKFTLFISYNPLDQGTGNLRKRKFLRIEFNPEAAGPDGVEVIFRILTKVLGSMARAIYHNARTTRVDLTLDFYGVYMLLYLLSSTAQNSRMESIESRYPTQYVGSKRSRLQVRYYYKTEEQLMKGVGNPRRNTFRLEVQLRDVGCSLAELSEVLTNPFLHIKLYDAEAVDGDQELSESFLTRVKRFGINKALYMDPPGWLKTSCPKKQRRNADRRKAHRDRYMGILDRHQVDLYDSEKVWTQLPTTLSILDPFDTCLHEAA